MLPRMIALLPRLRLATTLASILAVIVLSLAAASDAVSAAQPPGGHSPRRLALLVGINDYPFVKHLHGAVQDVRDMKKVLTSSTYGFIEKDVKVLEDAAATGESIKKAFQEHLINQTAAGDIVVFHFSGHGSQLPDKRDPLGWDNTIVPYDSRDPKNRARRDITDKELNGLLRQLAAKTQNITVILDSCNSGTGLKDALNDVRKIDPDMRFGNGETPPQLDSYAVAGMTRDVNTDTSGFSTADIRYVLMAAARSDQLANEYTVDGTTHGALTYFLVQQLNKLSPYQRTYRDIMDRVRPTVSARYLTQWPQLEGTAADQVIFQDKSIPTQPYITAQPDGAGRVQLGAGAATGMTVGSRFDVYPPGAKLFKPPEKQTATIELDSLEPLISHGRVLEGKVTEIDARAVERIHSYGTRRTKVLFFGLEQSTALRAIRQSFAGSQARPIEVTTDAKSADIALQMENGKIAMRDAEGRALVPPTDPSATETTGLMHERILKWARWMNLRGIQNASSTLRVRITLCPKAGECTDQGLHFKPNEPFSVKIENKTTDRKIFVYIFDFTSLGVVRLVYPDDNGQQPINAGKPFPIPDWFASVPDNQGYIRDTFKVIATTNEIHPDFLQQGAIKGVKKAAGPLDPLNEYLADAALGTKDGNRQVAEDWTTAEVSFDVCAHAVCK